MIPYLTPAWRVVRFNFGLEPDSPHLPAVLWVRLATGGPPVAAHLVTAQLLATLAWRIDSANASGPPGSPEAVGRVARWLATLDALRDEWERLKAKCRDWHDRYDREGGPPPLPSPPRLDGLVLRRVGDVDVLTPWDGVEIGDGVERDLRATDGGAMVVAQDVPPRRKRRRAKR